jgi:phage shock protein C
MDKRLQRSRTEKMIAGVCGGLAEYFDVDPTIVRILWVIVTLLGGAGIILYIVLWVIMPLQRPGPLAR